MIDDSKCHRSCSGNRFGTAWSTTTSESCGHQPQVCTGISVVPPCQWQTSRCPGKHPRLSRMFVLPMESDAHHPHVKSGTPLHGLSRGRMTHFRPGGCVEEVTPARSGTNEPGAFRTRLVGIGLRPARPCPLGCGLCPTWGCINIQLAASNRIGSALVLFGNLSLRLRTHFLDSRTLVC